MPNTLLTITQVTRELLMILKNNLVFAEGADRRYENQFAVAGAKIGDTLNIRLPPQFTVQSGPTLVVQNYLEESVPLVITSQKHCDVSFSSVERTLSLDDWSRRIGQPQSVQLANTVDRSGLETYVDVYNSVLSPALSPTTSKWEVYLLAGAILDQEGTPRDGQRSVVLEPMEQAHVVTENKGLFQQATQIGEQYVAGEMGRSAGFTWKMDQNIVIHTTGQRGGTPTVTTGNQTGSTIATTGWTAAAALRLKKGDVIQLAGVYAVNPMSRQTTGRLRDFTVTADVSSDASGNATIPISPAIILAPDPRQTVSNAAAASAPITFLGTANTPYAQNLAYHRRAFTLAMVDLVEPNSGRFARLNDPDAGLSMRSWQDSDINTDMHPARVDILYGWKCVRPAMAVRVWSPLS
jgi:hypothetical protein